jgi:Raf kinase inhibitor-like YbhB/YbcL family protein
VILDRGIPGDCDGHTAQCDRVAGSLVLKGQRMRILSAALVLMLVSGSSQAFDLKSDDIKPGGTIADAQLFDSFGCTGGNLSPELSWKDAPAGTKSFALMMFDSDAPTGHGFLHWLMFNIPANVSTLAKGAGNPGGPAPKGAEQTLNDFALPGYGGPCPPQGDAPHRYHFVLYALSVDKLGGEANADAQPVVATLVEKAIEETELFASRGR